MYRFKDKYILDFSDVKYYLEFHAIIKKELDLPDYYGCNFDALWDCLKEMITEPLQVEIIGISNIRKQFDETADKLLVMFEKLKEFAGDEYSHNISVKIIEDQTES